MKLLLDLGNTRLKWAWLEAGSLRDPGAELQQGRAAATVLAPLLRAGIRPDGIELSSVAAPERARELATLLLDAFEVPVRMAETAAVAAGVRNGYRDPRQLGVDRWLAVVAAYTRYRQALCVVDAGTALTVDAVAADGSHLGGLILPGPALMRSALLRDTGGLESAVESAVRKRAAAAGPTEKSDVWGRDTASGIRLAAVQAAADLVEGSLRRMAATGESPQLVLTGGDAAALQAALSIPAHVHPLLVLEGLAATTVDATSVATPGQAR